MKRAVIAILSFDIPAKRDQLFNNLKAEMAGKPTWEAVGLGIGQDRDGRPSCSVEVRFDNKADGDDLFSFIKQKMSSVPVLKGSVSVHNCSHDEQPVPCVIEDQYIK